MLALTIIINLSLVLTVMSGMFDKQITNVMKNGGCVPGSTRDQQMKYINCVKNADVNLYNTLQSQINGKCNQFLSTANGENDISVRFCNTITTSQASPLYDCMTGELSKYIMGHMGSAVQVLQSCNKGLNLFGKK